jgi:hypothetical protein
VLPSMLIERTLHPTAYAIASLAEFERHEEPSPVVRTTSPAWARTSEQVGTYRNDRIDSAVVDELLRVPEPEG